MQLKSEKSPNKSMPFSKKPVGPLRMKAENSHRVPVLSAPKSPPNVTNLKSGEGSVTMTEVLRLINLNNSTASNLDVSTLDQASKA